ncbi:dihydrofolate reductase [candidate division KSB1 bacterium]|nr:dihydrofolate reductase [candidate division KSB1 bacterium]
MMKNKVLVGLMLFMASLFACQSANDGGFKVIADQFADLRVLRYRVPGFDALSLQQKKLVYYLYQAALSGRDITYDQNYKHNLLVRRTLESVVKSYTGDKSTNDFEKFMVYAKRVWFSNGIHHHYSTIKFLPEFSEGYFAELVNSSDVSGVMTVDITTPAELIAKLTPIMFDPNVDAKRVNLNSDVDMVVESANNYYEGVTQAEAEAFYDALTALKDPTPPSYGLNSKLVKENGVVKEKVWKVGGMYGKAIEKIVYWLEKASSVAENDKQKKALDLLATYYKTGDLRDFDAYNIAWVQDVESTVDAINGFIEVYGDPLGYRASYESVVSIKDAETTKRIDAIGAQAQWFEDNSPIMDEHKKASVKGISAKVITVVVEAGDTSPSSPIGINLPNANWIRKEHGSKSVTLGNITRAYNEASQEGGGTTSEFAYSKEEVNRAKKYGSLASDLHTDMHEVIGHASGQLEPGVGTTKETLKNYASALEEARADLVALYYLTDQKLVDIGVMPSIEVGKAEYDSYIRNGLMVQLRRLKLGEDIEEAHMRNRQMVAKWVYEKGQPDNVIEKKVRDGKTYFVINDYEKLRDLFGQLLREVQRVKSQGDYEAGKALIENYGVKVEPDLHKEVLERFANLNIAPYSGFINPRLVPVMEGDDIVDVKVEYPDNFVDQMMEYAKNYSFLPTYN